MAKKKVETEESVVEVEKKAKPKKDLASLSVNASVLLDRRRKIIPVSPIIDVMIGGGIPEGTFVVPTGPPKVGKSSMCLQFAANALDLKHACELKPEGRTIYFFNIEGRLELRDLLGIHGFTEELICSGRVQLIESKPGDILVAEDYIERGEELINKCPGDIFIFDSFSQLCTRARMDASYKDRFRDDTTLLLASFVKRICNVVPVNRSIVMGVTHLIANQGGMGHSPWSEASGQKVQYAQSLKLKGTHKTPWKVGETQIGQEVHWKCENSPLSGPGQCTSFLRYGYGLDKETEIVNLATDLALIEKGGAWYTIEGTKLQGQEKAREFLVENPAVYDALYSKIREMFGFKGEV